ncbi:MAG: tetratricopeptide repeat protein [Elusimicrobiales bacterium]|nr:tetratricopeptide repeat protein [Elusimicrobiales bacterium]
MPLGTTGKRLPGLVKQAALALLGGLLALALLETALRLGGRAFFSYQDYRNRQAVKARGNYRVLCLGESTTAGQYPPFLEEILNRNSSGIKFSVIDRGEPSVNTSTILARLEKDLETYKPDMVVAMMGCNDRGTLFYGDIPEAGGWLFKNSRAYRFLRLNAAALLRKAGKEDLLAAPRPGQAGEGRAKQPPRVVYGGQWAEPPPGPGTETGAETSADIARAWELVNQEKLAAAEELFKRAASRDPASGHARLTLGWFYFKFRGNTAAAQREFQEAFRLNPRPNPDFAWRAAWFYRSTNRPQEAVRALTGSLERFPGDERLHGGLAALYGELGEPELAAAHAQKARKLAAVRADPVLTANYLALKRSLDKRKIRLVSVQYPMRDPAPLKKIFEGGEGPDVIFVDNEAVFRKAVEKEGYAEYFTDMFGGDFGHCSAKGNRLLADNISGAILKTLAGD